MSTARAMVLGSAIGALAVAPGCGSSPAPASGSPAALAHARLGVGAANACVVLDGGAVACWGNDEFGQLGIDAGRADTKIHSPSLVSGVSNAVDVGTRGPFSCALLAAGNVACWGINGAGQLGNGTKSPSSAPTLVHGPAASQVLGGVTRLAVGLKHACAVTASGSLFCWGVNSHGQLGNGSADSRPLATQANGSSYVDVSVGRDHTCAVTADGAVWCAGANENDQLGTGSGSPSESLSMVQVPSVAHARSVSAGDRHTCALLADGSAACWGGTRAMAGTELQPANLVGVAAGTEYACGLASNGHVSCWGSNAAGQIGDRTMGAFVRVPFAIPTVSDASALSAGEATTCIVDGAHRVRCWGANVGGEAGNGTSQAVPSSAPFTLTLPGSGRAAGT